MLYFRTAKRLVISLLLEVSDEVPTRQQTGEKQARNAYKDTARTASEQREKTIKVARIVFEQVVNRSRKSRGSQDEARTKPEKVQRTTSEQRENQKKLNSEKLNEQRTNRGKYKKYMSKKLHNKYKKGGIL